MVKDDSYRDFHIPKGAVVIPNIWFVAVSPFQIVSTEKLADVRAMTQDPDVYPEPHIFRPERFLDGEYADPREAVFGFGRR